MSNTPTSNSRTKNQHIIVIREPQILYKLFWLLEPKVKDKTHPSVCAFEFFYLLFWILLPFEFFVFSCCVDWFEMNFKFDFVLEFCDTIWVTSAFFFAFLVAFYCFLVVFISWNAFWTNSIFCCFLLLPLKHLFATNRFNFQWELN